MATYVFYTYDYKGKKINGTSTSSKVFSKSGVKKARKKQTYLNTTEGHVYQCTKGGKPKEAKWKYLRTDVVKKPTLSVYDLGAPVRISGTRKMKATWKIPKDLVNTKKGDRATELYVNWYLGIKGKDPKEVVELSNERTTTHTINLDNLVIGSKTYKRSSFYPFKNKPKLNYVTATVISHNAKGNGKSAKSTREFKTPRKPAISAFTFNAENGHLSCTITTNAGNDYQERYDTRYTMTVYYSSTKKTSTIYNTSTTATSKTITFDDTNYASRGYKDYAKVTVKAWARGYKGPSDTVTKTFYISYPAKATIKKTSISSKSSTGRCIVYIATNSTKEHPVDRVKLEYLPNSDYATESQIPGDASWEQTDIIDDAQCNAMSISVTNLIPDSGKYTWIRLKTYHANESVLYRYSDYERLKALETPAASATDDKITVVSATAGEDGQSALVILAWDDGDLPSTGTELSWDTEENAWKSTKEPNLHNFEWEDKTSQGAPVPITVDGVTYPHSATITIKDLEESEKYYIKARRYLEDDNTTYSEYSNAVTMVTSEKPESVFATADRYIPKGSNLNVYWTFSGNGLQKEWQIVDSNNTVIANGTGSLSSTQIDASRLSEFAINNSLTFTVQVSTGSGFVVSEECTVTLIEKPTLAVNASSTLTAQPYSFTAVASVPSDLIVIVTSQGITGQYPQGILRQTAGDTIYSDVLAPEWIVGYVLSDDTEVEDKRYYTYDNVEQEYVAVNPDGDESPVEEGWYEETAGVSTTVELPPQLDFWDLGAYTISTVAIDRQTELKSDEVISNFAVAWAHQAPSIEPTKTYTLTIDTEVDDEDKNYYAYDSETQTYTVVEPEGDENPSEEGWYELTTAEYVTVTPQDYTDDNGTHHLSAQINLTPPPNYAETDVYDIYRVTGDGAQLIGQGFPLTYVATDEYAPFGEDMTGHYRIATRTIDGDVAFSDVEYVLEYDGLRFDWSGGYIEYPYSVSIGDSYTKDVDIRRHLNGSINGYWNQGIERKSSLSTDTIKILQGSEIDLTRQLARYTGPVFVRTREGTAFEANVQITDLSTKNIEVMSIAIDAVEIDLTNEFMLPTPFTFEEEQEDEGSGS